MSIQLVIKAPNGVSRNDEVHANRALLGRSSSSDVTLAGGTVSRRHAEVWQDMTGQWWVRDLESINGTFLNAAPVLDACPFTPGDIITIGEYEIQLVANPLAGTGIGPLHELDMSLRETFDAQMSRVTDSTAARVEAGQLDMLLRLGAKLSGADSNKDRRQLLCNTLVGESFHGWWATDRKLITD